MAGGGDIPGPDQGRPDARHRVFFPDLKGLTAAASIEVAGDEAHHALKVKRLRGGETVELFDGAGAARRGVVADVGGSKRDPVLVIEPGEPLRSVEPVAPRVMVASGVPKPDRLEWMIDQLSQAGAAAWYPLLCERGAAPPAGKKLGKLSRIAIESAKQCGRAWLIEIGEPLAFEDAVRRPNVLAADAEAAGKISTDRSEACVLVGPEGGWSDRERTAFDVHAVPRLALGPHIMRIETAALAATSRLLGGTTGEGD